jgi:hypothetical protein
MLMTMMVTMMVVVMVAIVVMPTMVAREEIPHRWALVMAFVITWLASFMT